MTVKESERGFQDAVVSLARMKGWMVAHFRPARTKDGRILTPVGYDGAGFPDLVLVGNGRVIFAELKTDTGRLSPRQKRWLEALEDAKVETAVWRPRDWQEIVRVLSGGAVDGV